MAVGERIAQALGLVEDRINQFRYHLMRPPMYLFGVDIRLTKNRDERVVIWTEIFEQLQAERGISEIKFAAGGDDGDLDDFADALVASGVITMGNERIKITQMPEGGAPPGIREQWIGVELTGLRMAEGVSSVDVMTGQSVKARDAYYMFAGYAIRQLEQKSPEAAEWFKKNLSPEVDVLSFGVNEVEALSRD